MENNNNQACPYSRTEWRGNSRDAIIIYNHFTTLYKSKEELNEEEKSLIKKIIIYLSKQCPTIIKDSIF